MNASTPTRAPAIAVAGPGAMGLLWSAYLDDRLRVCLVGRTDSACRPFPFVLTRPGGSTKSLRLFRYPPSQLPETPSAVLMTTKAQHLEKAFAGLVPRLSHEIPIIFFQNGLGAQLDLSRKYPDRPLLAASTTEGANRTATDQVIHAGRGQTWVGGLTPAGAACAPAMTTLLAQSGLSVETDADIEHRLWRKLAINAAINPFSAILGCRNGDLPGNAFFEQLLPAVIDEFIRVASAHQQPFSADELSKTIHNVAAQTAGNRSSMLQDLEAGKATEIAHLNGFLVTEGERLGLATPVNQKLTQQVLSLRPH